MATTGRDRYSGGSSSAYSALMRQPKEDKSHGVRIVLALALTLVCPPLGIAYAWRAGVFPVAGRVALTAVGCLILCAIFYVSMPNTSPQPITPTPVSPSRITAVSNTDVTTALSNIDSLLGLAEDPVVTEAPKTEDQLAEEDAEAARKEEILNTIVYAVPEDAKYYHVADTCRDQINSRRLTIRDAISEGLQPCGRCNPPVL